MAGFGRRRRALPDRGGCHDSKRVRTSQEAAPRLSIVVLPFENIRGDKDQDYFADGITDNLTTDLSHLQDSFVISRGTAFTYKGRPINAQTDRPRAWRALSAQRSRAPPRQETGDQRPLISATHKTLMCGQPTSRKSVASSASCSSKSFHGSPIRLGSSWWRRSRSPARGAREHPSDANVVDLAMQTGGRDEGSYASDRKATVNEAVALSERALALDPQNLRALTVLDKRFAQPREQLL